MPKSLSRKKDARKSLLRNLVTSLILYEEIKTTEAKAKVVKPILEHLIFRAKKNDLAGRRALLAYLYDKKATQKVFEVLVPRYKKINSGFVLSYRFGERLGDSAPMIILKLAKGEEIVAEKIKEENGQKTKSQSAKKSPKSAAKK